MMNVSPLEPSLAPPGAGLPSLELFLARTLFRWHRLTQNRHSFHQTFQFERSLIRQCVLSLPPHLAHKRCLIPRLRGLEDSSRFWSVWMTLDHLRIVHTEIQKVILLLSREKSPQGAASTAAVKPSADQTEQVVLAYEQSCDDLVQTLEKIPNLHTRATFPHPWFGPLNAAGWHALASMHLKIHRKQIETILHQIKPSLPTPPRPANMQPT